MLQKENVSESRVSKKSQKNSRITKMRRSNVNNYDERIIPTLNKMKTEELSEFPEQN